MPGVVEVESIDMKAAFGDVVGCGFWVVGDEQVDFELAEVDVFLQPADAVDARTELDRDATLADLRVDAVIGRWWGRACDRWFGWWVVGCRLWV